VLAYYGNFCYRCGADGKRVILQIHHLTYARLGHENLTDVRPVCKLCHQLLDEQRRQRACARWLARKQRRKR